MADSPLSDRQVDADEPARPHLADTVRKVNRAVARLEELQCLVRATHSSNPCAKPSNPTRREKLALHARDTPRVLPNRHIVNEAQHAFALRPITSSNLNQGPQQARACKRKPALPIAASRRSARVAALPPPSPHRKLRSISHAGNTLRGCKAPCTVLPPPPEMPQSSPPSSACSSSVPVVTRRAPFKKEVAPSKPPRTFVVNAGSANPNRPWCLSASPSPATTSSTTSNYICTPSSNSSSAALPIKSPSRFSPLYRQSSRSRKNLEGYQSQPLLCKSPETITTSSTINPIKGSPSRSRKVPWFSQTRLSLPTLNVAAPDTKKSVRRFSLAANTYYDSPPRPLPALITRLPMRRKNALSPDKKGAAIFRRRSLATAKSTSNASPQKGQTVAEPAVKATITTLQEGPQQKPPSPPVLPLPLPPALQGQAVSSVGLQPTLLSSSKRKVVHKRSSSCPRQCLLPVTEGSPNALGDPVTSSLQHPSPKLAKGGCLHASGKENCFPGCSPAAWPCMRRSWSFNQQPSLENLAGAGPYIVKQVKGYMQHGRNMHSRAYKVDSIEEECKAVGSKLYMG